MEFPDINPMLSVLKSDDTLPLIGTIVLVGNNNELIKGIGGKSSVCEETIVFELLLEEL